MVGSPIRPKYDAKRLETLGNGLLGHLFECEARQTIVMLLVPGDEGVHLATKVVREIVCHLSYGNRVRVRVRVRVHRVRVNISCSPARGY